MPTQAIPLSRIVADPACQPPERLNPATLDEYTEAMAAGAMFPPLSAKRDGGTFYLWDGFHRLQAAQRNERAVIRVDWGPGTRLDAIEAACGANATHGLRRTNKEKRWSVETMFRVMAERDENWSDGEVARRCGVSDRFVGGSGLRPTPNDSESTPRTGADGRTISTANIGKARRSAPAFVETGAGFVGNPAAPAEEAETLADRLASTPAAWTQATERVRGPTRPMLPVVDLKTGAPVADPDIQGDGEEGVPSRFIRWLDDVARGLDRIAAEYADQPEVGRLRELAAEVRRLSSAAVKRYTLPHRRAD